MRHSILLAERSKKDGSDAGETLVEVLISLAVLGITVTALLGALVTTITSASEHRTLASLDTVLRSYAEQLKYDVELQPNPSYWFTDCAPVTTSPTPSTYAGHTLVTPSNMPSGYAVVIQGIQYWDSGTNQFDASCGPNDHTGFQLVTLMATAPNGVSESLSFGLRQP